MTDAWSTLNPRQQTYLRLVYAQDQAQERAERQRAALDWRSRPAEEWRQILYADTMHGHTPLKQAIKDADMVDPGTGSTFKALEDRGYLRVASERATSHPRSEVMVYVWLTTLGRRVVREALNVAVPKKPVVGTLQEWHWRALAKAYAAGSEGVPRDGIGYGRIGWKTWLRLRDYTIQGSVYPLIEEGIHITPFGLAYYERSYQRYCKLYPEVEAVSPAHPVDPHVPYIQELQDTRQCHACQGAHLVAVTHTYQQDQRWTWSVQQQEHRIPGEATSRYRTIVEHCRCQEQDIQEISLPFMDLLDQLAAQNWRVRFPRNHWMSYLEFLVSDSGDGQAFYDPILVQQRLSPLLEPSNSEMRYNVAKGEIRYCFNEQVGQGCVYLSVSGPFARVPVVVTRRADPEEGDALPW